MFYRKKNCEYLKSLDISSKSTFEPAKHIENLLITFLSRLLIHLVQLTMISFTYLTLGLALFGVGNTSPTALESNRLSVRKGTPDVGATNAKDCEFAKQRHVVVHYNCTRGTYSW